MNTTRPPYGFSLMTLVVNQDQVDSIIEKPPLCINVIVNTLDLSLQYEITNAVKSGQNTDLKSQLPHYAERDAQTTAEKIVAAYNTIFPSQIKSVSISPAINTLNRLLSECHQINPRPFESFLPGKRNVAYDTESQPIHIGDYVLCVDDTKSENGNDIVQLELSTVYKVIRIHDRPELATPMLIVDKEDNPPVLATRFRVDSA